MDLHKMSVEKLNGTCEGDILCALWYLLVFMALGKKSGGIEIKDGKVVAIKVGGESFEPTFSGINKAMRLGRCRDGKEQGN